MKFIDINYIIELFKLLIKCVHITISIAVLSMIIGLVMALILVIIRLYKIKILYPISRIYVSFFRGTPLLVQLFLLYYGIPQVIPLFSGLSAYNAAVIGLSLNASAYMVEVLRASISSVDKGQMEACLSVGMTHWQGMKRIVFPQAARVAVPSLGNIFIDLVKGSSLAFIMGVADILAKAQMSAAATYRFFESYLVVAIMYWIIIAFFSYLQNILERKLNKSY